MLLDLPCHQQFDPLTLRECGVDGLQRFVAQRAQPLAVCAQRLDDVGIHAGFGPENKGPPMRVDLTQVSQIDIAAIGQQPTPFERLRVRQKALLTGRIRRSDHRGRGITEQVHGRMECDGRGLDRFATPGKHLA